MQAIGQEYTGTDAEKPNADGQAQEAIPENIKGCHTIVTEKQVPLGSFLSEILSADFKALTQYMAEGKAATDGNSTENLDLTLGYCEMLSWNAEEDAPRLYMIRRYIELCAEFHELFSMGQFQLLLGTLYEKAWHPKTLGFFALAKTTPTKQFFSDQREHFAQAKFFGKTTDLSALDSQLESIFLGSRGTTARPTPPMMEVFEVSNVMDLALLSLFHLIQDRMAVKICQNCSKPFVPMLRSDAIYCDRPSPQDYGKTCKEYASKIKWYENIKADDTARLARNIYCAKQMIAKRNPGNHEYEEMFEYFKDKKKQWEQMVEKGAKTQEDYVEWLQAIKPCRTMADLEKS